MLDRSVAPPSETISKPNLPSPEIILVSEDIELVMLRQHDQPVIMLELAFPTFGFGTGNGYTAYLASKMLTEGTSDKTSGQIAEALDFHGSHLEIRPGFDFLHVRFYCLKKHFSSQLHLIRELLSDSVFPEREFEKAKNIRIQQIKQQHAKTNAFASLKFRETIFGPDHFYGKITTGEMIRSVSLQEAKDYYHQQLLTKPSVFLAGDISQDIINDVNELVQSVPFASRDQQNTSDAKPGKGDHIQWNNSVQSSIRIGLPMIDRHHPDTHMLSITNELLGGFFGSRLMKNIREEKGLTYGIHSSIAHLKEGTYWVIGTDVLKEKADLAVSEIKKEIERLATNAPAEEELTVLKSYLKGKWLMSFDNCFNSMQHIMYNRLAGLNQQHWLNFLHTLDNCTADDINNTANKYLNKDLIEVVVG